MLLVVRSLHGEWVVVVVSALAPVGDHCSEVFAEGVFAEHGHGAASDHEVVGGEVSGALEGASGGVLTVVSPKPVAEAEFGAGALVVVGGQVLERSQFGGWCGGEFTANPLAEQCHLRFGGDVGVAAACL